MIFTNKRVILVKLEGGSYGVDAMPDATNAILCSNITLTPFAGSAAKRARAYPNFGASADALTGLYQTLGFDVEMAGSGAAGTPPLYGPLLRMCGLSETITVATKVVYAPVSASQDNGTVYFNWGGLLHKLTGARGTVSMKLSANGLPMYSFALTGLFNAVADAALADVATQLESFVDSIEVNKANTTFSLHGYAAVMESLQIDLGNAVVFRDRPNAAYVALTDRAAAGQVSFEAVAVGTKAYFAAAKANTLGTAQFVHGTVGGNIVQFDASKLQFGQPTYQDVNGVLHVQSPFGLKRDVGDDELSITVK